MEWTGNFGHLTSSGINSTFKSLSVSTTDLTRTFYIFETHSPIPHHKPPWLLQPHSDQIYRFYRIIWKQDELCRRRLKLFNFLLPSKQALNWRWSEVVRDRTQLIYPLSDPRKDSSGVTKIKAHSLNNYSLDHYLLQ